MEIHKIVNLDAEELALQMRQSAEQIFRLRFQLSMGQNEGVKKLRELKKDIARIKTVERQRELGIAAPTASGEGNPTRTARKTKKSRSKTRSTSGHANKSSAKTSRKSPRVLGKSMAAGRTSMKSAKRGKANAKKGGS